MDFTKVSGHMARKLQAILPTVAGSHGASPPEGVATVDLSIAENDLLRTVEPDHIITTAGAGNALDALLCSVCDEADRVLVAGPCWEGFGPYFLIHANVKPITVTPSSPEDAAQMSIVDALQEAYHNDANPDRIRAVVLTNPNNPRGQCYAPDELRECLRFCHAHDLHLISDEVYALSSFESHAGLCPFVSILSLLEGDAMASRVHVIWSMSKDFGCSGIRMGCIISQANPALRFAAGLASYWQVSSLTSVMAIALLNSVELPMLLQRNSEALGVSYRLLTEGLDRLGIQYVPANYGLFVFAKLVQDCRTAQEEIGIVNQLARSGLIVAQGQKFSPGREVFGWVRITFSTSTSKIEQALRVLELFRGQV
ncbi:pyridoxal phosphate-dependent transferase [Aspergillus falconensis]